MAPLGMVSHSQHKYQVAELLERWHSSVHTYFSRSEQIAVQELLAFSSWEIGRQPSVVTFTLTCSWKTSERPAITCTLTCADRISEHPDCTAVFSLEGPVLQSAPW